MDVIGICCGFTEYESLEEFNHDYQLDLNDLDDIKLLYDSYSNRCKQIHNSRFLRNAGLGTVQERSRDRGVKAPRSA